MVQIRAQADGRVQPGRLICLEKNQAINRLCVLCIAIAARFRENELRSCMLYWN